MLDCIRPVINGKALYARVLLKFVGWYTYLGEGLYDLNILEEEKEDYLNHNKLFFEAIAADYEN